MKSAYEHLMRSKVVSIVQRNHEDPGMSSPSIARHLGISRRQLDRFFQGGASATALMLEFRLLSAASRLLSDIDSPVLDVALDSGFNDVNTFRSHFQQAFGMTPTKFRRRYSTTMLGAT